MARPGPRRIHTAVRFTPAELAEIDELALRRELTRSQVIRAAVAGYVKRAAAKR